MIERLETDEDWRRREFPACRDRIFMAHAAVTAIPQCAVHAMDEFNRKSATGELDYSEVLLNRMDDIRVSAGRLIEASPKGIALLGPTSLGLSLVANGLNWKEGDEIIAYQDDYPANVYPWKHLENKGVRTIFLQPCEQGQITPELVEGALSDRTRLIALASCHFLTGYRLNVEAVSDLARKNEVLFCLDAIQTVGAFPTSAQYVDFLCADSHKWMLGPMTAGIFYVDPERFEDLEPTLLGAWNVKCPNFVANDSVVFEEGGRRYEPGVLNSQGLFGMNASIEMLCGLGIESVSKRLLELKESLVTGLESVGLTVVGPRSGSDATAITSVTDLARPSRIRSLYSTLMDAGVVLSSRVDRGGVPYLRFSPHFYNTHSEVEEVVRLIGTHRT